MTGIPSEVIDRGDAQGGDELATMRRGGQGSRDRLAPVAAEVRETHGVAADRTGDTHDGMG
jgi:hypothetical protein